MHKFYRLLKTLLHLIDNMGRGGGQMLSALAFFSDDQSSNSPEYTNWQLFDYLPTCLPKKVYLVTAGGNEINIPGRLPRGLELAAGQDRERQPARSERRQRRQRQQRHVDEKVGRNCRRLLRGKDQSDDQHCRLVQRVRKPAAATTATPASPATLFFWGQHAIVARIFPVKFCWFCWNKFICLFWPFLCLWLFKNIYSQRRQKTQQVTLSHGVL